MGILIKYQTHRNKPIESRSQVRFMTFSFGFVRASSPLRRVVIVVTGHVWANKNPMLSRPTRKLPE
jgi:hypothetical protein